MNKYNKEEWYNKSYIFNINIQFFTTISNRYKYPGQEFNPQIHGMLYSLHIYYIYLNSYKCSNKYVIILSPNNLFNLIMPLMMFGFLRTNAMYIQIYLFLILSDFYSNKPNTYFVNLTCPISKLLK